MNNQTSISKLLSHSTEDQALISVIENIFSACVLIREHLLKKGNMGDLIVGTNDSGDDQKRGDMDANEIIKETLKTVPQIYALFSEEEPGAIKINPTGEYMVCFDPLDGSSNLDVNISVGTIFSIVKKKHKLPPEDEVLQRGRDQVAAGYVLYGPATTAVVAIKSDTTVKSHVHQLQYISSGDWVVLRENLKMPLDSVDLAVNMSNKNDWAPGFERYVLECIDRIPQRDEKKYSMRWVGSMVADINRVLIRGGVFIYPYTHINQKKTAKLRLLYEVNPMALLVEQAGGIAMDGESRVLDILPESIHQKVGAILGCQKQVEAIMRCLK